MAWRYRAPAAPLALAALVVLAALPSAGRARQPTLDEWVAHDLSPYLATELSTYPLFKGAVLRFVVLDGDNPAARSNALALGLRDRLLADAVDTPGLRIAWRPADRGVRDGVPLTGQDCGARRADFLIGIEVEDTGNDGLRVAVRALDVAEQRWVAGFGLDWRGAIGRAEARALRTPMTDRSFLGDRGVPFADNELDMLAARLAEDLGCALMRQVSGEYVIAPIDAGTNPGDVAELVGNNVVGLGRLRIAATPAEATARLESNAHRIDGALHQVWVRIVPTGSDPDLLPVGVSAYLELPQGASPGGGMLAEAATFDFAQGDLLQSLSIVRLASGPACAPRPSIYSSAGYTRGDPRCSAIELRTRDDAVVFLLNHQPNHGLVRIDDGACRPRTAARIARAGEALRLALPGETGSDAWAPQDEWSLDPRQDTYYAIAVRDARAARALAKTLDRLPQRCSESLRVGYEGRQLDRWLNEFARELSRWRSDVDWRALTVREVY